MVLEQFTWVFVVGVAFAFFDSFGIGANDVANSFATSVGSRSLTLKKALLIATFTELGGALLLGASVASTIKSKIIDITAFTANPELLLLGFVSSLVGSSIWVVTAARFGWPVSTTHATIGSLIGVGISSYGADIVRWEWDGVGKVVASWFISPALAGIIGSLLFLFTKFVVLKAENSFQRGLKIIPFYFSITVAISTLYVILKNGKKQKITSDNVGVVVGSSIGAGAFVGCLIWLFYVPWLKRRIENREKLKWYHVFYIHWVPLQEKDDNLDDFLNKKTNQPKEARSPEMIEESVSSSSTPEFSGGNIQPTQPTPIDKLPEPIIPPKTWFNSIKDSIVHFFTRGLNYDVVNIKGEHIKTVHNNSPKYDNKTEFLYSFLQVLTAAFASFAHGSNDVANAIGPFAGAYSTWLTGEIPDSKTDIPFWMLVFGGIAIDLGLLLYGYRVMRSLGNNITYHSPSRGFCMELGAAITVITASFLGIPVSTTHCITGATAAVGIVSGNWKSLNYKMLSWCFFSWIITLPIAGGISGLFFAALSRSPSF